jgi:hypothetical protein
VVAPREGVVLCEGAELCDCVAACEGAAGLEGAALGAGALVLCWPHAIAGTISASQSTSHFRKIPSLIEVRFITAS